MRYMKSRTLCSIKFENVQIHICSHSGRNVANAAEEKMQPVSEIVRIVAGTLTDGSFFFITFFFAPEVKEPLSPRRQVLSRTQEGEEKKKK